MIDKIQYMLMLRDVVSHLPLKEKIAEWKRMQELLPSMIQECIESSLEGKWHCDNYFDDTPTPAPHGLSLFTNAGFEDVVYKICPKCVFTTIFQNGEV